MGSNPDDWDLLSVPLPLRATTYAIGWSLGVPWSDILSLMILIGGLYFDKLASIWRVPLPGILPYFADASWL